ncbi:MAG TPA: hypothetical protein VH476_10255 [Solirubrobacterales bacterium]
MKRLVAVTSIATALVVALLGGPAGAGGETVVPVEGPWHATTSVGLPVGFEVSAGQVVNPRWRFKWGFCGSFENATAATVPVNSDGYWKYTDPRGPWIEGTFVAPNRLEGTVTAPGRMLPGCPETHAAFVAEPGAAKFEQARVVVLSNVITHRLATEPKGMLLKRDRSLQFHRLKWENFGQGVARGHGQALLRHGCRRCRDRVVIRRRVVIYLNELTQQGRYRRYLHASYYLIGPLPPGFPRNGSQILE